MPRRSIAAFDERLIRLARRYDALFMRIAFFAVYAWFGFLKVISASPATGLVEALSTKLFPTMNPARFSTLFGVIEVAIGVLFLIPGFERLALVCLFAHMVAAMLPLVLLPDLTWNGFLMPTLEGQYILKNIILLVLAVSFFAQLRPLLSKERTAYRAKK